MTISEHGVVQEYLVWTRPMEAGSPAHDPTVSKQSASIERCAKNTKTAEVIGDISRTEHSGDAWWLKPENCDTDSHAEGPERVLRARIVEERSQWLYLMRAMATQEQLLVRFSSVIITAVNTDRGLRWTWLSNWWHWTDINHSRQFDSCSRQCHWLK